MISQKIFALKEYGRSQKRRDSSHPVSFDILQNVLAQLLFQCSSAYEVSLFKTAFSLAFFVAFRISKLVSPSKRVHGGMLDWEVTCGEDRVSLLLLHADGSPLSRFQFISIFRKCLRALGLEEKEFILHSFRIGAAMEAARCGLDDEVAKRRNRKGSSYMFILNCCLIGGGGHFVSVLCW